MSTRHPEREKEHSCAQTSLYYARGKGPKFAKAMRTQRRSRSTLNEHSLACLSLALWFLCPLASLNGQAASCAPRQLLMASLTLNSFVATSAGYPAVLQVQVIDDCGNIPSDTIVVASFSN